MNAGAASVDSAAIDAAARVMAAFDRLEFDAIAEVDTLDLKMHPHRAVLSLIRFADRLERADLEGAEQAAMQAVKWGVRQSAVATMLLAGAHRDLMRVRQAQGQDDEAERYRATAGELARAAVSADTAAVVDETSEAARLRAEVMRLRKLVEAMRSAQNERGTANPGDAVLINRILSAHLTYLSRAKLLSLAATCREVEAQRIPGLFLEAGCALGGSAILIAKCKTAERPLQVYDVFGMIPPPSENDPERVHERYRTIIEGHAQGLGSDRYYGYELDLLKIVQGNFGKFDVDVQRQQVSFLQGMVQDTLAGDEPIALAHLDLDWHDPVKFCLERIFPRLSIGGSIIVDDYHDWPGCRQAVDDFLAAHRGQCAMDDKARSMKITRVRIVEPT
ncbi:MAG: TylF/MycF/NovP-related O-methyltransferase [Betaproteobacteria bacterium]